MRHAAAEKLLLAGDPERTQRGTGGDDDRPRAQALARTANDVVRAAGFDRLDGVEHEFGARRLRLLVQQRPELVAAQRIAGSRESSRSSRR